MDLLLGATVKVVEFMPMQVIIKYAMNDFNMILLW